MTQGILYKNEEGTYQLDEANIWQIGDEVEVFDEDLNEWLQGSVQRDQFGEYYFVDDKDFMVIYLYEGLLGRIK